MLQGFRPITLGPKDKVRMESLNLFAVKSLTAFLTAQYVSTEDCGAR